MIYVYRCDCGHVEDILKSYKDLDRLEPCPICSVNMTREFSIPLSPIMASGIKCPPGAAPLSDYKTMPKQKKHDYNVTRDDVCRALATVGVTN